MPIKQIAPQFNDTELLRLLGGRGRTDLPDFMKVSIEKWKKRLPDITQPRVVYDFIPVSTDPDAGTVTAGGAPPFNSPRMAKKLKDCKEAVCFAATIGPELEKEIEKLTQTGDMAETYILDAIGSVLIESAMTAFALDLDASLRKDENRSLTRHFSPGYCEWDITEQQKLFKILDTSSIGVSLTDSSLMKPRKSVSGLCGILPYKSEKSIAEINPCQACTKKDCFARRTT